MLVCFPNFSAKLGGCVLILHCWVAMLPKTENWEMLYFFPKTSEKYPEVQILSNNKALKSNWVFFRSFLNASVLAFRLERAKDK